MVAHAAHNIANRRSVVPDDIAANHGYAISHRKRKLVEQGFGWAKVIGRGRHGDWWSHRRSGEWRHWRLGGIGD